MSNEGEKQSHLCVLIHGLWGNPNHLNYLTSSLRDEFPDDKLHILLPKTNAGNFTYDGIEVGGERVTKEIEEEIEFLAKKGVQINKLSVVGYSLGGLVARYAIGILYHKGVFDRIQPVNFTTFASPHLGVRSPINGVPSQIWNVLGARTLSVSGRQLFLIDSFRDTDRPLLSVLADPDSVFIRALSEFKNKSLYSNIVHDRSAVFYTTCISATDPYADLSKININYLPDYAPVLVDSSNPVSPVTSAEPQSPAPWFSGDTKAFLLRARLGVFFTVFLPIGSMLYLMNAAVQNIRSSQRIRLHASGKAGIVPHAYHIPLGLETAQRTAETVFESMNSAHAQEYLEDNDDSESDETEAESADPLLPGKPAPSASVTKTSNGNGNGHAGQIPHQSKVGSMVFPTLALTEEQFGMIDALDKVGFKKFPVHIHEVSHTHAAIIVRMKRESFKEGKIVIGHWLKHFEI